MQAFYMGTMRGPLVIRGLYKPQWLVINTINHSYWSYVHQLSYRLGAPLCVGTLYLGRLLSGACTAVAVQRSTRFNVQQVALYTFQRGVTELAPTQLPWYATSCGTVRGYKLQMFPAGKEAFSANPA